MTKDAAVARVVMVKEPTDTDLLAVVRALVELSAVDLLYADRYLERAGVLLPKVCTREQYLALRRDQESLPRVAKELHQAVEREEWAQVRILAQQATQCHERVAGAARLLEVAGAVYGPRLVHVDATALALAGVVVQAASSLGRARDAILDQLRFLLAGDEEDAAFYRARLAHFEALQVVTDDTAATVLDGTELRKRILQAADRGEFGRVQRLADSILSSAAHDRPGRLRAPPPADGRAQELAAPFPLSAVSRARDLGLALETLPANGELNSYLSCCCADRATLPQLPLTEKHRRAETCTCGHPCPPEVGPSLRENLDLLLLHPFVSSAGTRYLPWFGPETLLVETFPETDADARTGMLDALGLPRRRGLARITIEDAIRTHTTRLCMELGLDPIEFTVANIPFDAYLRLAAQHGWGQQQLWTHFDGYQVTRAPHLRALVGGDVRYGGPNDFCSIERDYETDRLIARFAVLRRQRFVARGAQGS